MCNPVSCCCPSSQSRDECVAHRVGCRLRVVLQVCRNELIEVSEKARIRQLRFQVPQKGCRRDTGAFPFHEVFESLNNDGQGGETALSLFRLHRGPVQGTPRPHSGRLCRLGPHLILVLGRRMPGGPDRATPVVQRPAYRVKQGSTESLLRSPPTRQNDRQLRPDMPDNAGEHGHGWTCCVDSATYVAVG